MLFVPRQSHFLGGNACCSQFIKVVENRKHSLFRFYSAETGQSLNICVTDTPEEKKTKNKTGKKGPQDKKKRDQHPPHYFCKENDGGSKHFCNFRVDLQLNISVKM